MSNKQAYSEYSKTLTLTLIHPASNWTHWATLRRHSCLSRAATLASSQVNPIFCRSLLTVLLQFTLGRPGPLLYPGTCQYSVCCGVRWWFIRKTCPDQRSHLSLSMLSMVCCPVLVPTSMFVILYFHKHKIPSKLLCHLWCAASRLLVSAVNGHTSAPYRRVDNIIASYSLQTNTVVSPDLSHFTKYCCCFSNSYFFIFLIAVFWWYVAAKVTEIVYLFYIWTACMSNLSFQTLVVISLHLSALMCSPTLLASFVRADICCMLCHESSISAMSSVSAGTYMKSHMSNGKL